MSGPASVPGAAPPPVPDHELLGLIGRGSYGEVWLARSVLGVHRAIKIVYRHNFEDERPFERELAGIRKYEPISRSHEGLLQVLHVGRNDQAGCFYYVMELADPAETGAIAQAQSPEPGHDTRPTSDLKPGALNAETYMPRTLRSEITRRGSFPLDELLTLGLSLTSTLAHLHNLGLAHRDLKPSNIIFVQGRPKIADIGLVSGLGESHSFVGTEGFIPPEGPGTSQADLFSLGKVLYEASTGNDRLSFPAIPEGWLGPPPQKEWFEFHEIPLKACEGAVAARYARAEEMHADLALLRAGKSIRHVHLMERRVALLTRAGLTASGLAVLGLAAYLVAARDARLHRTHAERLERAEQLARAALQEAYLMQARAGRRTGLSGCRFDSLEALRRAAKSTNSLELRNEAIACLALADVRALTTVSIDPRGGQTAGLDAALEHYVVIDRNGAYHSRRLRDAQEDFVLRLSDTPMNSLLPDTTNRLQLPLSFRSDLSRFWKFFGEAPVTLVSSNLPPHLNLSLSPNGAYLVLTTPGGKVDLYAMTNGAWLRTLELDGDGGPRPVFSADCARVAVWRHRVNRVSVLNLDSGSRQCTLPHPTAVTAFAWGPDNHTLVTASLDFVVRSWDTETGRLRHMMPGHQALVNEVVFHPNRELLASLSWDGTIRLWDVATGLLQVTLPLSGTSLRFTPDGRRMGFVTFGGHQVLLYEVAANRVCRFLQEPSPSGDMEAAKGPRSVVFDRDEHLLISASYDGVRFWDLTHGVEAGHLALDYCWSAFFDTIGRGLIVCGQDSGVQRWGVEQVTNITDRRVGPPVNLGADKHGYGRGCMSREDGTLAYLWRSQVTVQRSGEKRLMLPAGFNTESSLAVSPDGRWLAVGARHDKQVQLWDLRTRQRVWMAPVHSDAMVAISPDGRWAVSNSGEEIRFYDLPTGRRGLGIRRPTLGDVPGPVEFSPDGRVLAASMSRTVVQLLEVATGRTLGTLESPAPRLASWIAFSPSGTHLAIATEAHLIELWDLRALRQQLAELGLDWDQPPFPPPPSGAQSTGPIKVIFLTDPSSVSGAR